MASFNETVVALGGSELEPRARSGLLLAFSVMTRGASLALDDGNRLHDLRIWVQRGKCPAQADAC